jgi:hypothetical protein
MPDRPEHSTDTPLNTPPHTPEDTPVDTRNTAPLPTQAVMRSKSTTRYLRQPEPKVPPALEGQELMDAWQVAAFLKVHVKTIHRWRRTLGLPCVLVGGRVRFFPSEVIRWVSARKEG